MKRKTFIIALVLSFIVGNTWAVEFANISGNAYFGSQPLNGMVLANGSYMFTSAADGRYDMDVPLDSNGKITLFFFCDGFAPFRQLLKPEQAKNLDINMTPTLSDSMVMSLTAELKPVSSGWVEISGKATYKGIPLCMMVLANGSHMFTNGEDGLYKMTVPLNEENKVNILGFCDGFAPYKSSYEYIPQESSPEIISIETGTSFGECLDYCEKSITITPNSIMLAQNGRSLCGTLPEINDKFEFTSDKWKALTDLADFEKFSSLPDRTGCPDCNDGGAEWIKITKGCVSKKIIFEYESSFDEIEDLLTELRELREFCYENSSNLVTRNLSPDVSDADLNELVNGNSEFAFDFYHELVGNTDGNLFFSPHSISTALAMTYAGARNNTEKQMADVLHFTLEQESLHPAFNALDLELASRGENAEATDGKGFRLNIANSLWGQEGYPFLNSFLDMTAANYGSGMTFLDFARHPEPSRTCINKWVYYNTETRIEDLIPKGEISSSTVLVLVNAIYFNAAWRSPFSEKSTHDGTFYLPDSSEVTTPLMWQEMKFGYTEGENYQATELPYDGEELSMTVLLPKEGQFEAFEKTLTSERLDAIIENMETQDVYLTLPKFSFESDSLSLKDTFTQMGMEDPFIGSADFSGIDGSPGLRISNIFHKAFVAVDEAGTEAAAATGVSVDTSLPDVIYDFKVNRPFIFFIRDIDTGAILFIGRIVNPVG